MTTTRITSARTRWLVTIVSLVVVFSIGGVLSTGALLHFGARAGGSQWVRRSIEDSAVRINDALLTRLATAAERIVVQPAVADAAALLREDDGDAIEREVARLWTLREANEHFGFVRAGAVLGGDSACRGQAPVVLVERGSGVIECDGVLYLAVLTPFAGSDDGRATALMLMREIDQGYVDTLSEIVLTEIVIETDTRVITSLKDIDGGALPLRIPRAQAGEEGAERSFVFDVDLPRPYAGVHASTEKIEDWPARNQRSFAMLVHARPFGVGTNATIAAMMPLSVLTQGPMLAVGALAVTSLVMLVLQSLVASRLIARYTRPLSSLERAADAIARGDLSARVVPEGDRELVSLGRSFNHMVERLLTSQTQLLQSEKLAALGHLSAGLAHEINTPIQFIGDNTDFQRRGIAALVALIESMTEHVERSPRVDDETRQALARLRSAADFEFYRDEFPRAFEDVAAGLARVNELVEAMRVFSSSSIDQREQTDVAELLATAVTISTGAWKYVADVRVDVEPGLPQLATMRGEMSQALTNIIINAAQAIEERNGSSIGHIAIDARADDDGVCIRIHDDGVGIAPEAKPHIFEPFFTTKPVGCGTGHGLTIAYATVVERHGGRIDVESAPGEGATVSVWLPVKGATAPAA